MFIHIKFLRALLHSFLLHCNSSTVNSRSRMNNDSLTILFFFLLFFFLFHPRNSIRYTERRYFRVFRRVLWFYRKCFSQPKIDISSLVSFFHAHFIDIFLLTLCFFFSYALFSSYYGVSRSATIVTAYIMRKYKLSTTPAMERWVVFHPFVLVHYKGMSQVNRTFKWKNCSSHGIFWCIKRLFCLYFWMTESFPLFPHFIVSFVILMSWIVWKVNRKFAKTAY